MNPYRATTNVTASQPLGFRWGRVLAWSVLLVIAVNLAGFLSGLSMVRWSIYGASMEEAISNARLVRRIAVGIVTAVLYWRLAAPIQSWRWLHVAIAFLLAQVLDVATSAVVFGASFQDLASFLEPGLLARSILAALVGLGLARLGSNNSSKPTPLRGAA